MNGVLDFLADNYIAINLISLFVFTTTVGVLTYKRRAEQRKGIVVTATTVGCFAMALLVAPIVSCTCSLLSLILRIFWHYHG